MSRAHALTTRRPRERRPPSEVIVQWRRLPARPGVVEQIARDVIAIVTGHPQMPVEAREVYVAAGRGRVAAASPALAQVARPLSYTEARELLVGAISSASDGTVELATAEGRTITTKLGGTQRRGRTVFDMQTTRRPMVVNIRPGKGGHNRTSHKLDPCEGLDEFPPALWRGGPAGSRIGIIELNPDGNAVGCVRLSSQDNETAVQQIHPILGLENRYASEFKVRYLLLAIHVSGKWEVRPDRAPAPIDGTLERQDMLLLDEWIGEGWLRHVIWRDGDRIARDILPGETLLRRWEKNRVGLWLATYGRQMDYERDRLQLRAMMMVSAEERDNVTRRLGIARINKGPLAGNGWASLRYGFYRDPVTKEPRQDLEQAEWILKAFHYAATGDYLRGEGLSTRKLAEQLAREGCPFDHDRLRAILRDPIYATGEWTANVRGVPVAQKPMPLDLPVPLTLYQAVQNLLGLRQGHNKNTPLGEFLLNYVEAVHKQCAEERKERKVPPGKKRPEDADDDWYVDRPRLRGHVDPANPDARRLRHGPFVPECCRGGGRGAGGAWTWENEWLEPPIVRAIRELAEHPAVLEEAARAAHHDVARSRAILTDERRAEREAEIENLLEKQAEEVEKRVALAAEGKDMDLDSFQRVHDALGDRIHAIRTELALDKAVSEQEADPAGYADRVATFLDLMTVERPDDPFHKAMRARLFQRIVSKVEIDDDGDGPITVTIYGHLAPPGSPIETGNPVLQGADLLDAYDDWKNGRIPQADQEWERVQEQIETALSSSNDKSVWSSYGDILRLPGQRERVAMRRAATSDGAWRKRNGATTATGMPMWVMEARGCYDGPDLTITRERRDPVSARLVEVVRALGRPSVRDVTEHVDLKWAAVRRRLLQLAEEGELVRIQGSCGPGRGDRFAVSNEQAVPAHPS